MILTCVLKAGLPALGMVLFLVSHSLAGAPTEQVRTTVEKVSSVLKDPRLKSEAQSRERREQLRKILYASFDFSEMARRSLGSHWRRLSPKEQGEFVQLFTDLLERAYLDKIESYYNETFRYSREKLDGSYAEVETRIGNKKGEEYTILYKLQLAGSEWKVYDVVVENISVVNNYRSQFSRIITGSSYHGLVQKLKAKQVDLVGESK
jgi:phospholipid transport system substrate-binding protein